MTGNEYASRCSVSTCAILSLLSPVGTIRLIRSIRIALKDMGEDFDRQLTWERTYLNLAAIHGCIIFWLPSESTTHPHPGPEPYAMDTRGELGEWRGRLMHDPSLHVVIGAEDTFFGLSQIERNFHFAVKPNFPFYDSLQTTVQAAIVKALR